MLQYGDQFEMDFDISQEIDFNDYLPFDEGELGAGNNAGPSTSTANGNWKLPAVEKKNNLIFFLHSM